jgi:sigma-B regulation protein RsbU (phosphoserine phosphatase)
MINHIKKEKVLYSFIGITAMIIAFSVIYKVNTSPYYDVYFAILMLASTVLGTMLSGVFYLKGRLLNLTERSFVMVIFLGYIINNCIAIMLLHADQETFHQLVHLFIAYGQLCFASALFFILSHRVKEHVIAYIQEHLKMIMGALLVIESITALVYMNAFVDLAGLEVLINLVVTILLLRIFIDQLSQQKDLTKLFPMGALVIAQSYLVIISEENKLVHIIVSWLIILGIGLILKSELSLIGHMYKNHNYALYKQFNIYSQNLQKLIDKKTLEIKVANQEIINELEYAKVIQQSLLPPRHYSYRDTIFMSAYYPCERLSGDFYDIFRIDDEYIALYYMDVAGHGISAALLTMLSNNFLRATDHHFKRLWAQRPDKNLKLLYDHFNTLGLPDEMHLVIFYATYNLTTHVLTYCSGGMNCSPIVFRQNGTYELLEQSDGFPICKMDDVFTPVFNSASIVLKTGDRVVFYTDGLTDLAKNKIFDEDELIAFCRKHRKKSIREFNLLLEEQISPFKDNLNDDLTYIVMDI